MDLHLTCEWTFKILDDYLGTKLEKPKVINANPSSASTQNHKVHSSNEAVHIEDVTSEEEDEGVTDKASKMKKPKSWTIVIDEVKVTDDHVKGSNKK